MTEPERFNPTDLRLFAAVSGDVNPVHLDCKAINQDGKLVASGTAEVMAPADKMVIPEPPDPIA